MISEDCATKAPESNDMLLRTVLPKRTEKDTFFMVQFCLGVTGYESSHFSLSQRLGFNTFEVVLPTYHLPEKARVATRRRCCATAVIQSFFLLKRRCHHRLDASFNLPNPNILFKCRTTAQGWKMLSASSSTFSLSTLKSFSLTVSLAASRSATTC
ncbi:hypothetical protein RIF29_29944 [Crotalaria pallida]|uniref:Uncharacterized protein n=1 Tax=Crotalaria pallida TaxID=3830 RepID=A0AAN9HUB9_CROPI